MAYESSTREMIERALSGSKADLEQLLRGVQGLVHGLALRMLRDRETARDATQEILIRVATTKLKLACCTRWKRILLLEPPSSANGSRSKRERLRRCVRSSTRAHLRRCSRSKTARGIGQRSRVPTFLRGVPRSVTRCVPDVPAAGGGAVRRNAAGVVPEWRENERQKAASDS